MEQRQKVLKRHQAGDETLEDLADRFEVSLGWVKKISAAFTRTGKMERPRPARLGRKSKMTPELDAWIRTAVAGQPDLTLAELQFRLGSGSAVHHQHRLVVEYIATFKPAA
jgi:transposase